MAHQSDIPGNSKSEADILTGVPVENHSPGIAAPGLSRLSHKVQRNLEDYGWQVAVKKSVAYLLRAVYFRQVYRLYRIDLDEARLPQDSNPHNFTFKILTVQNVGMIADVENVAEWLRGQLKQKIAAGQLCMVALDGNKIAAATRSRTSATSSSATSQVHAVSNVSLITPRATMASRV